MNDGAEGLRQHTTGSPPFFQFLVLNHTDFRIQLGIKKAQRIQTDDKVSTFIQRYGCMHGFHRCTVHEILAINLHWRIESGKAQLASTAREIGT